MAKKVHYMMYSKPLCKQNGRYGKLTTFKEKVTCKKCRRLVGRFKF